VKYEKQRIDSAALHRISCSCVGSLSSVALFCCIFSFGTFFEIIRVYTVVFSDPPTAVVRLIVFSAVLIAAAIAAGIIRSKVYFWIPSFLLIFICFAIFYPDNLPRFKEDNIINLPWIAEYLGYGTTIYSAICQAVFTFLFQLLPYTITRILIFRKERKQSERTH